MCGDAWQLIAKGLEFISPYLTGWTPANWIAFGTACCSLVLGVYNNRSTASRERLKNKREEFHRRVAVPIEQALDQFDSVIDDLHDLLGALTIFDVAAIEPIERRVKASQRKLSRGLRFAANSALCGTDGWNIGGPEYDEFVLGIENARVAQIEQDRRAAIEIAIGALERHNELIREKIRSELAHYT
jgi:hypothetical protein